MGVGDIDVASFEESPEVAPEFYAVNNVPRKNYRVFLNVPFNKVVYPAFYDKRSFTDLIERRNKKLSSVYDYYNETGQVLTAEVMDSLIDETSEQALVKGTKGNFKPIVYVNANGKIQYALVQIPDDRDDVIWSEDADPIEDSPIWSYLRKAFINDTGFTRSQPFLQAQDATLHFDCVDIELKDTSTAVPHTRYRMNNSKAMISFLHFPDFSLRATDTVATAIHNSIMHPDSPGYDLMFPSAYSTMKTGYDYSALQTKIDTLYNKSTLMRRTSFGEDGAGEGIQTFDPQWWQAWNHTSAYTLTHGCNTRLQVVDATKAKAGLSLCFRLKTTDIEGNSGTRMKDDYASPLHNFMGQVILNDSAGIPKLGIHVTQDGFAAVTDLSAGIYGSDAEKLLGVIDFLHGRRSKNKDADETLGDEFYRIQDITINVVSLHDGRLYIYPSSLKYKVMGVSEKIKQEDKKMGNLNTTAKSGWGTALLGLITMLTPAKILGGRMIILGVGTALSSYGFRTSANSSKNDLNKLKDNYDDTTVDVNDTFDCVPYIVTEPLDWKVSYSWTYYANPDRNSYFSPAVLLYDAEFKVELNEIDNMMSGMTNSENKTGIPLSMYSYTVGDYVTGTVQQYATALSEYSVSDIHPWCNIYNKAKHSTLPRIPFTSVNEELDMNGMEYTLLGHAKGTHCNYYPARQLADAQMFAPEPMKAMYNPVVLYDLIAERPDSTIEVVTPSISSIEIPNHWINSMVINRRSVSEGRGCQINLKVVYPDRDTTDTDWLNIVNAVKASKSNVCIYYDNILIYRGESMLDNSTTTTYKALRVGKQYAELTLTYQEDWIQHLKEHSTILPMDLSIISCVSGEYTFQPSHTTAMRYLITRLGITNDADLVTFDDTLLPLIGSTPFATQSKNSSDTQWLMSIGTPMITYVNNIMEYSGWILTSRYTSLGRKIVYANRNIFPTFPDDCRHYFIHDSYDELAIRTEGLKNDWEPTRILSEVVETKEPAICNKMIVGFWKKTLDARNIIEVTRNDDNPYDPNFMSQPKWNYVWMPFSLLATGGQDTRVGASQPYKPTYGGMNLAFQIAMRQMYASRVVEFTAPLSLHLDYGDYVKIGRLGYGVVLSNEIGFTNSVQVSRFKIKLMQTDTMCFFA